jgi:hypothetical protein
MDYSVAGPSPTIKSAVFPNTISGGYWTSTGAAEAPDFAWYVAYYAGGVYTGDKSNSNYLRCVRNGPSPGQNYKDNSNGTFTDQNTGLTWQKENYASSNWGDALSACETSNLANHTDWRLPNVDELKTLIDDSRRDPAIDNSFFPFISYYYYWTSTTVTANAGQGFVVGFGRGNVLSGDKGNSFYAVCVRGVPGVILPVRIGGSYYSSLQEAYDAAHDGDTIEAMATTFTMDLTVGKQITIKGGFDGTFSSNSGYSTIDGNLTIQDGSLVAANIVVI